MNAFSSSDIILPGATVGVLGSGQLGRMFALAARRMGYRVATLSPDSDTPTGQVADIEVEASYDDLDAVRDFARQVSVVTFEFENVPSATVEAVAGIVPVRPGGQALHIAQNRLREKNFLSHAGIPHTPFRAIRTLDDLQNGLRELGYPAVLKTAGFGYDGKGQWKIGSEADIAAAWADIGHQETVLEAFVSCECELSVVGARGMNGEFVHYGLVQNEHSQHILDVTTAPALVAPHLAAQAEGITQAIFEQLDVVGVLCVEFFLTSRGELLVNEIAPRPHNSGHWTIDGCVTSQFEQQLRAVCGLPLGSVEMLRPGAAMANILGDLWPQAGSPNWSAACLMPGVKLHLYGKDDARPGRKMGHLTTLAETPELAAQLARDARAALVV